MSIPYYYRLQSHTFCALSTRPSWDAFTNAVAASAFAVIGTFAVLGAVHAVHS